MDDCLRIFESDQTTLELSGGIFLYHEALRRVEISGMGVTISLCEATLKKAVSTSKEIFDICDSYWEQILENKRDCGTVYKMMGLLVLTSTQPPPPLYTRLFASANPL